MLSNLKCKLQTLNSDKKFSEILTGSAWALVARVGATALTFLISIIVARVYGAEALGLLAVVQSFIMLATIFTVLGTKTSILRLIPEHIAKYSVTSAFRVYRKIQYIVGGVALATGTILFFSSGFVADKVFSKAHLTFFFALAAVFVIFKSLMDLNTQAVRGLRLIRIFALMQIIPTAAMLIFLIAFTVFSRGQGNPIYAQLASWALTAVIGALIMDRAFKIRLHPEDSIQNMGVGKILSLSLPMLMTASMQFLIGQTGVILLGIFRSEAEVGHYSISVKLATLTAFILQAINTMAAPKFSELFHQDKMDELFYVAKKSTKLIFWTTTPILLLLIFFGKSILLCFFGTEFVCAYFAMTLLIIGQFVNSISGSIGAFLNMTGSQTVFRNIVAIAAGLNIIMGYILIPIYGINGAAVAGMVSLSFWNISAIIYVEFKYKNNITYFPMFRTTYK